MENLSSEGQEIYDTVKSTTADAHGQHRQDIVALIKESVTAAVDSAMTRTVDPSIRSYITKAMADMQVYADGVKSTMQGNLELLREQIGLAAHSVEPDQLTRTTAGVAEIGPDGHHAATTSRRPGVGASRPYISPPARGIRSHPTNSTAPRSFDLTDDTADPRSRSCMPKMDVPRFDGEHPKLWQIQCEDYFEMYETSPVLWVRLVSLQFTGPAARWLSSLKSTIRKFTWSEFCQVVAARFGRNQHQSLIRRLYKLVQTGTVADYVQQFAELMDQLAAYEEHPDMLHYVTRFVDGLQP
jgi:hypothetical protein